MENTNHFMKKYIASQPHLQPNVIKEKKLDKRTGRVHEVVVVRGMPPESERKAARALTRKQTSTEKLAEAGMQEEEGE